MSADDRPPGQSFVVGGKNNRVKKIKQKIVLQTLGTRAEPQQKYETKWSLRTPLTQGRLALLSVVLGVVSLVEGYQGFEHIFKSTEIGRQRPSAENSIELAVCVGALLLFIVTLRLWRLVRHRLRSLSRFWMLPALMELDGRLAVARFRGRCQRCGGRLHFYARPSEWIDHLTDGGGTKREVLKRKMVAECALEEDHWWPIEATESRISS